MDEFYLIKTPTDMDVPVRTNAVRSKHCTP